MISTINADLPQGSDHCRGAIGAWPGASFLCLAAAVMLLRETSFLTRLHLTLERGK